jgi:TPR repeat protein
LKTINKIIRYVLAAVAIFRAIAFFVFVSSSKPGDQEAAGVSFGAAVICGVIASVMFYRARNENVDLRAKPSAEKPRNSDSSQPTIIVREQGRPSAERQVEPPLAFTESIPSESDTDVPTAHKAEEGPPPAGKPDSDGVGLAIFSLAIFMVCTVVAIFVTLNFNSTPSTPSSSQANVSAAAITPTMLSEAKSGNAEAQTRIGRAYWQGAGVPKDYVQAVFWFRKAAEQGNATAQVSLGILYDGALEEVKGVPQDYAQAANWYRKAAEQGNGIAEFMLGRYYANGLGVPQDYVKAAAWYRKAAANQGGMPASAQSALGELYLYGRGVPKDYAQATDWFRKAADQNDADAELYLGVFYFYGNRGIPRDYAQAAAWYRKAADHGNNSAQYMLGQLYSDGQGVPQDYAQAAAWFQKAADQGNTSAQRNLGVFYAQGTGVPQSYADSYFWFNLAVAGLKGDDRETVRKARDVVAGKLTPLELSGAQKRATDWYSSHQQK